MCIHSIVTVDTRFALMSELSAKPEWVHVGWCLFAVFTSLCCALLQPEEREKERKRKNKNYFCPEDLSPNAVTLPCQPQDTFLLGWLCEILYFMAVFLMILFLKTISAAFCSRSLQSPLGQRRSDPLLNGAVHWFQDELSDFTGSKSATPMSTTASDVEREDGSSKSAEVQAAPGTRSISVGRLQAATEAFSKNFFPICMSLFVLLRRPAWQRGQHRRAGHHRVHARARHGCDRLQALQVETLVQVVFFVGFFSMRWTSLPVLSPDPAAARRPKASRTWRSTATQTPCSRSCRPRAPESSGTWTKGPICWVSPSRLSRSCFWILCLWFFFYYYYS